MARTGSSTGTRKHDDVTVRTTISSWRAVSAAQRAAYDPDDETRSEFLFASYTKALKAIAELRPSSTEGLLMLARAVQEEMENSGLAEDCDLDWRLMSAVLRGVVDVLGS